MNKKIINPFKKGIHSEKNLHEHIFSIDSIDKGIFKFEFTN
jgi:hypothetical protein